MLRRLNILNSCYRVIKLNTSNGQLGLRAVHHSSANLSKQNPWIASHEQDVVVLEKQAISSRSAGTPTYGPVLDDGLATDDEFQNFFKCFTFAIFAVVFVFTCIVVTQELPDMKKVKPDLTLSHDTTLNSKDQYQRNVKN